MVCFESLVVKVVCDIQTRPRVDVADGSLNYWILENIGWAVKPFDVTAFEAIRIHIHVCVKLE